MVNLTEIMGKYREFNRDRMDNLYNDMLASLHVPTPSGMDTIIQEYILSSPTKEVTPLIEDTK